MKNLLALLLAFFRLGVGDPDPDEPELDLNAGDPDPDPQGDPDAGDPDPQGDPDPEPDYKAEAAEERRLREEDKARADRYEREAADLRASQSHSRSDPLQEEEERILKDPNATDLQKWQVNANREIRASKSFGQNALAQAQDISDKTSFGQLAVKNPPLFKRYEKRVEEEYQKLRAKGTPAPRESIMRFLIGDDALKGELTKKTAAKKADNPNLNRGKLPGARSDLNGKNALSEREKRRARLENVQI